MSEIPDEAIQAAAEAIHARFTWSERPDADGGFNPDAVYGGPGEIARVVLESVVPGLLAEAWSEGSVAGWSDRTASFMERRTYADEVVKATPNPYDEKEMNA
jgi:hypothetical protein